MLSQTSIRVHIRYLATEEEGKTSIKTQLCDGNSVARHGRGQDFLLPDLIGLRGCGGFNFVASETRRMICQPLRARGRKGRKKRGEVGKEV